LWMDQKENNANDICNFFSFIWAMGDGSTLIVAYCLPFSWVKTFSLIEVVRTALGARSYICSLGLYHSMVEVASEAMISKNAMCQWRSLPHPGAQNCRGCPLHRECRVLSYVSLTNCHSNKTDLSESKPVQELFLHPLCPIKCSRTIPLLTRPGPGQAEFDEGFQPLCQYKDGTR
jgi:hypothetical protein